MQPLWAVKGASHQLVRDESCSCFLWSASLEHGDCSKTQNKPYWSPCSRAPHIHSPVCTWASLLTLCAALCTKATPEHTKKRQHTFIFAPEGVTVVPRSLDVPFLQLSSTHPHLLNSLSFDCSLWSSFPCTGKIWGYTPLPGTIGTKHVKLPT